MPHLAIHQVDDPVSHERIVASRSRGCRGAIAPALGTLATLVGLVALGWAVAGCSHLEAAPTGSAATPRSSHDGMIAFVRSTGRESDLLAVEPPDGSVRPLVTGRGSVSTPAWSADGRSLAYAWRDPTEGGYRIRVADADGSNERSLTPGDAIDASPTWSPAGDRLAYSSNRGGPRFGIYLIGRDGSNPVRLTDGQAPAWSPTGDWIAFVGLVDGGGDLFLVRPDGNGLRSLTSGPADDVDPAWTPDGTAIVFASDRAGNYDLYRVELVDGTVQPLLSEPGDDRDPAVSPDGRRVVFSRTSAGTADLWVLDVGGTTTRLTNDRRFDADPAWQPLAEAPSGG